MGVSNVLFQENIKGLNNDQIVRWSSYHSMKYYQWLTRPMNYVQRKERWKYLTNTSFCILDFFNMWLLLFIELLFRNKKQYHSYLVKVIIFAYKYITCPKNLYLPIDDNF